MTENELLAELAEEMKITPLQADEVTVQQISLKTGASERAIRDRLDRKVKAGDLVYRWTRVNGCRVKAYRKP